MSRELNKYGVIGEILQINKSVEPPMLICKPKGICKNPSTIQYAMDKECKRVLGFWRSKITLSDIYMMYMQLTNVLKTDKFAIRTQNTENYSCQVVVVGNYTAEVSIDPDTKLFSEADIDKIASKMREGAYDLEVQADPLSYVDQKYSVIIDTEDKQVIEGITCYRMICNKDNPRYGIRRHQRGGYITPRLVENTQIGSIITRGTDYDYDFWVEEGSCLLLSDNKRYPIYGVHIKGKSVVKDPEYLEKCIILDSRVENSNLTWMSIKNSTLKNCQTQSQQAKLMPHERQEFERRTYRMQDWTADKYLMSNVHLENIGVFRFTDVQNVKAKNCGWLELIHAYNVVLENVRKIELNEEHDMCSVGTMCYTIDGSKPDCHKEGDISYLKGEFLVGVTNLTHDCDGDGSWWLGEHY